VLRDLERIWAMMNVQGKELILPIGTRIHVDWCHRNSVGSISRLFPTI
jgi:hypothetical protein